MSPAAAVSHSWTRWALGAVIVAGVTGVGLRLAGVHSAPTSALVLVFLAVAPTVASYGWLHAFEPFPRVILACATTVTFLTLTATLMLAEDAWSPLGGLLAVTGITLICLVAQWPPVSRRVTPIAVSWRKAVQGRTARDRATDQETSEQ